MTSTPARLSSVPGCVSPSPLLPLSPSPPHDPPLREIRIPRPGAYLLLAAGLLLGIGLFKAINLLTLLGCMLLVVWGLNLLLAGRGLRNLRGRRRLAGPVFAGSPAAVFFEVEVVGRSPRAALVEDQGPSHRLAWFLAEREGLGLRRWSGTVVLPARGRYAWGPLVARSGYPFGLVERQVVLAPGSEQLVLPRLGALDRGRLRRYLDAPGFRREPDRRPGRRHPAAQAEFHGLRAFRSGDSPRWIHWRTSARCNDLMVREFEDVPSDDLVLVLDPAAAGADRPCPALEAVLSLAATVCWEWCRQQGDRLVLLIAAREPVLLDGLTGAEHARRLLEALAVVEAEAGQGPGAGLAGLRLPAAPVLLLSAGPSRLRASATGLFRRPIAALTAADLPGLDFYRGPAGEGRPGEEVAHAP